MEGRVRALPSPVKSLSRALETCLVGNTCNVHILRAYLRAMSNITLLAIDLAKNVFQLHGVNQAGGRTLAKLSQICLSVSLLWRLVVVPIIGRVNNSFKLNLNPFLE